MDKAIILGIHIDDITKEQAYKDIIRFIEQKYKMYYVVTPNPEICLKSLKDETYKNILNRAHLSIPDGAGLILAGKILNSAINQRVLGRDICKKVIKYLNKKSYKATVLLREGGLSSASEVIHFFKKYFPKVILQVLNVNISDINENDILNKINEFNPKVCFSALGAPFQEKIAYFLHENKAHAACTLCVGGSIDYLLGKQKLPPKIFEKIGLEWLWRLFTQPKRFKRIFNAVIKFPAYVIYWKLRMIFKYRHTIVGCIINKENKILIEYLPYLSEWSVPQGGIAKGETIEQGILREIKEELGISKDKLKILSVYKYIYSYKWPQWSKLGKGYKGQKQSLVFLKFLGDDNDITFPDKYEVNDIKWVSKEDLVESVSPIRKESAKEVLNSLKKSNSQMVQ